MLYSTHHLARTQERANARPISRASAGAAPHPDRRGCHRRHVGRTFALSYDQLDAAKTVDALALGLLARAACLAPGEPIPRDLLKATMDQPHKVNQTGKVRSWLRGLFGAAQGKPQERPTHGQALRRLGDLGLLEEEAGGALRLHRLLAAFVAARAPDAGARAAVEQAILDTAGDLNKAGIPAPLLALQAHLLAVTDAAMGREDEVAANLCNEAGYFLHMIGDYAAARTYSERALAISEQALGPAHPGTATSLNNLALLCNVEGRFEEAAALMRRGLAIRERALGPQHPYTQASREDLAAIEQRLARSQGDDGESERAGIEKLRPAHRILKLKEFIGHRPRRRPS